MTYFPRKEIDRGVEFVPPSDPTDNRTLTAEEMSLATEIEVLSLKPDNRLKFKQAPEIAIADRTLRITGSLTSAIYAHQQVEINVDLEVAQVWKTAETIKTENFAVITFIARVGEEIDKDLGKFSRQYDGNLVESIQENTRRLRCFWLTVSSYEPITLETVSSAIGVETLPNYAHSALGRINVNTEDAAAPRQGFTVGQLRCYAHDPNLVKGGYDIYIDSLELCGICQVTHYRNHVQDGYYWQGSTPFLPPEEIKLTYSLDRPVYDREILYRLMAGKPLKERGRGKAVLNSILGSTNTGSTLHPGVTSKSPNGSNIQGNDQRIFYSNEARLQRTAIQHLYVEPDGSNEPMVTATLNTENPQGSIFSFDRAQHRVYSTDGVLQNELGTFSDLGSDRSLSWFGNRNTRVKLGERLIVAPGIEFAAGSGFRLPFSRMVGVYYNGVPLNTENIRNGNGDDLDAYADPVGGEDFIVIYGAERASLQYIYKKISVAAGNNGVAIVPPTELGCFAFIDGVEGRIDEPVKAGLIPQKIYRCLVYYPPRSNGEIWQFELEYTPYQGLGVEGIDLLDGGKIVSNPINIIHTQGGGLSVHRGDSNLVESPIAMHLSKHDEQSTPCYLLNTELKLEGETNTPGTSLREVRMIQGRNLALPVIGEQLLYRTVGSHYPQSLNVELFTDDNKLLGYQSRVLQNLSYYQSVCSFLIQKGDRQGLVVVTHNTQGGENLPFDVSQGAAIDVFPV